MLELAPTTSSGRDFSRLDIFQYSFSNLAPVIAGFTDAVGLSHRFVYIEDYGAPVGLRLGLDRPNALAALITQNWPKATFRFQASKALLLSFIQDDGKNPILSVAIIM